MSSHVIDTPSVLCVNKQIKSTRQVLLTEAQNEFIFSGHKVNLWHGLPPKVRFELRRTKKKIKIDLASFADRGSE